MLVVCGNQLCLSVMALFQGYIPMKYLELVEQVLRFKRVLTSYKWQKKDF